MKANRKKELFAKLTIPPRLMEHPVFLMISVLKLARQQGLKHRQQSVDSQLNLVHFAVLSVLLNAGQISQKEVSQLLNADPSDLVSIIDHLESAGYVRRTRDEHDRRRYSLEVTEAGKAIVPRIEQESDKFTDSFLAPLTVKERAELQKLLLKIIAHYNR